NSDDTYIPARRSTASISLSARRSTASISLSARRSTASISLSARRSTASISLSARRSTASISLSGDSDDTYIPARRSTASISLSARRSTASISLSARRSTASISLSARRSTASISLSARRSTASISLSARRSTASISLSARRSTASISLSVQIEPSNGEKPFKLNEENVPLKEGNDVESGAVSFEKAISMTGQGKFHHVLQIGCGLCLISMITEILNTAYLLPAAECDFNMTSGDKGILTAICYLGMIASSHFWGFVADTRGRKYSLVRSLLLDGICALLSSFSHSYWLFLIFRFFNGF
ncbi:hypothetical protein L9F63_013683, partial [Diploptera punctata]